jgi:conjugative relaxase-like TrwC/TraI family protein
MTQERYYTRHLADSREEYYTGKGEAPGRWAGPGLHALGLGEAERVTPEAFGRMFHGQHPTSGKLLGEAHHTGGRPGYDAVFRPAKSISLLWAFADEPTRRLIHQAHQEGITQALGYLSPYVGLRRGRGGHERIAGAGLVINCFDHRTSRENDPLLHTHAVIFNRMLGDDGKWTALDGRDLFPARMAMDAIYLSTLEHILARDLGVEFTAVDEHGLREVKGISQASIRAFSKRRDQVCAAKEERRAEKSPSCWAPIRPPHRRRSGASGRRPPSRSPSTASATASDGRRMGWGTGHGSWASGAPGSGSPSGPPRSAKPLRTRPAALVVPCRLVAGDHRPGRGHLPAGRLERAGEQVVGGYAWLGSNDSCVSTHRRSCRLKVGGMEVADARWLASEPAGRKASRGRRSTPGRGRSRPR